MTPAPRSRVWKFLGYAAAALVALAVITGIVAEWRYGFVRAAPRADRTTLLDDAGVIAVVNPAPLEPLVAQLAAEELGGRPPQWVVNRLLPYGAGAVARLDLDQRRVNLDAYVNPRRLVPILRRRIGNLDFERLAPEIRWANPPLVQPEPGVLSTEGWVPTDPEAEEAYWYTWNQSLTPPPLQIEGGHVAELLMDNRNGQAYVVAASLLRAYDIDLDSQQHDISLSSLQFVEIARMTLDFAPPDVFLLNLDLDIRPDATERLGVINLKVAIEDGFNNLGERWKRQGIDFSGETRWDGTTIVYRYRLEPALKATQLALRGELF